MMMKVVVEMLMEKMTTLTTQEEELERNREAEAERQRREVVDLSSFSLSSDLSSSSSPTNSLIPSTSTHIISNDH